MRPKQFLIPVLVGTVTLAGIAWYVDYQRQPKTWGESGLSSLPAVKAPETPDEKHAVFVSRTFLRQFHGDEYPFKSETEGARIVSSGRFVKVEVDLIGKDPFGKPYDSPWMVRLEWGNDGKIRMIDLRMAQIAPPSGELSVKDMVGIP